MTDLAVERWECPCGEYDIALTGNARGFSLAVYVECPVCGATAEIVPGDEA